MSKTRIDLDKDSFTKTFDGKTARRVVGYDSNADVNALGITTQTITTTVTEVTFPEDTNVQVFHQTEDAIIYFGDADVDNTYPKLVANSTLDINARNDFTLYVVADSGSVPLFVMTGTKE